MGHMIQCLIAKPAVIEEILSPLGEIEVTMEELPQKLQCLYLCSNLIKAIHSYEKNVNEGILNPFSFFTLGTKKYLETVKPKGQFVYLETDYFGGEGTQVSAVFRSGVLIETFLESTSQIDTALSYPQRLLQSPINKALQKIGVIRERQYDEFDTLGLAEYRFMPDCDL